MSSKERKAELEREWEAQQAKNDAERDRRKNLSMYSRIEEFVDDEELKIILHAICERIGLED